MTQGLPRIALQLWIVFFIIFFGAEVIHLEPTLRVATQLLYGVPLAIWGLIALRGPRDPLDVGVLVLLGVYGLVCAFSVDRTESLNTLGLATAFSVWFLLMRSASASLRSTVTAAAATGFALTLALNAFFLIREKLDWYSAIGSIPLEGRAAFPWESVNALPVVVLLAVPFLAWLDARRFRSALVAAIAVAGLIVIPISVGRAGWLGLGVASLAVFALSSPVRRWFSRMLPHRRPPTAFLIVGVAGIAVAVGFRLLPLVGDSGRLLLWRQAAAMISAEPVFGSGPGSYSWARLEYAPQEASMVAVRLAHNAFVQTTVDGGLVLLLAAGLVAFLWFQAFVKQRSGWSLRTRVALGALVGYAAASTLDDFSYLPALTLSAITIAGFLVPHANPPASGTRTAWTPLVLIVAILVALPSVVAVDRARIAAEDARSSLISGRAIEAVDAFRNATGAHPENGGYWIGLGMAYTYANDSAAAREAYESATAVSPGDPRAYAALAALTDDGAARLQLIRKAAERTTGAAEDWVQLGLELAANGDDVGAADAWSRALAIEPELARALPNAVTSVTTRDLARRAIKILEGHPRPESVAIHAWDLGLVVGTVPPKAGNAWKSVAAARAGDYEQAFALARALVEVDPFDARGYQALAAAARYACDPEVAEAALTMEAEVRGAYQATDHQLRPHREFIYREAGLGRTQPKNSDLQLEVERWPWSLIEPPSDCS